MGSGPPGLLLLSLLLLLAWLCARGESSFIIDAVGLTILPSSTVQSGTPVTIRCQVSVSHSNIAHLDHIFQLKQDDVPIHTYNTTEDSVEYEINPARAADSGSYECRVAVKEKSRTSVSQRLDVTGLQTPTLDLSNRTPFDSEEFTATCSAPEEKGSLRFTFYQRFKSEEPEIVKQLQTAGNSSETTLKFRHIGEVFLRCSYEISLVSGTRRSNSSKETRVTVRALNIVPTMNVLPSSDIYEGDIVEVVCSVYGSPVTDIEVFLTKNKKVLKQVRASALSHQFTAQADDSGELVCKAEWGNVQREAYKTITVQELFSKPRLTVEPADVFEGDRVTLTCSVDIYVPDKIRNQNLQFSYYKDDVSITTANTYVTVAHPLKNGNYTCKVKARLVPHNIVKMSQTLALKAKVPVSKPVMSVVGGTLLLGKPFQLLCHSDNGTFPITYSLHGPSRPAEHSTVSRPGQQAVFTTQAIYRDTDLRRFLCHAKNGNRAAMIASGEQLWRSTRVIEPVSEPQLVVLPSSSDISEGYSMILICSVQRGSPPINFTWYHTDSERPLASQTSNELKASHDISNVRGEHAGGYYCESTNGANEPKRSEPVRIRVKMAGWKKGLIVVLCLLLLLAAVLGVAFKAGLLKRKRTGRLSVKSAGTKAERLSLTQAEVNEAANATPGMIGKSVWSEHVSGSESDDQNSEITSEKPEPQYTEVQTRPADPHRAPVKQGTDTVYSQVRNSQQGVPETAECVSVEYAELNHDTDHHADPGNHGDHSVSCDHADTSVSVDTGDTGNTLSD